MDVFFRTGDDGDYVPAVEKPVDAVRLDRFLNKAAKVGNAVNVSNQYVYDLIKELFDIMMKYKLV